MTAQQEDPKLARCRRLIEEKLGWGNSEGWSTQDFEQLGERIAEQTGVSLSVTTLKRVWGRVKYDSAPTVTTLNALAMLVGYEHWRAFSNESTQKSSVVVPSSTFVIDTRAPKPVRPTQKPIANRWWISACLVVILTSMGVFFLNYVSPRPLSPADFAFTSRPVTKSIPNSVVFDYTATSSPTDSVFIQQSWDPKRRQLVPKDGHHHSAVYYLPGYYRAKLVVGRQIVQEHDVVIPSEGWLTAVAINQDAPPVYFSQSQAVHDGILNLPIASIERYNIPMQPQPPIVIYTNVRPLNGLRSDNFVLETRVKNEYKQGSAACQYTQITILCRDDIFKFLLSAEGCVGNSSVYLGGYEATSKHADLSALGRNLSQWVDVRFEVHNKRAKLFLDGQKAYEAVISHSPTQILGIGYEFLGTGSVDYCRFVRTNGDVVFEDNFK